jgi:hypothetical protein
MIDNADSAECRARAFGLIKYCAHTFDKEKEDKFK